MKLAHFHMSHDRVISGLVKEDAPNYYEVQVVQVFNPCSKRLDWKTNDVIKISKELIIKTEWK